MAANSWTIVLAAGDGRRLASVTGGVPKQYWRPEGAQSLLEDTLARLRPLTLPERTITIVDRSHRPHVESLPGRWALGEVVYQPEDRGTAVGLLLSLAEVMATSPDALVVVTPCDHGVEDGECFRRGLRRAMTRVQSDASTVVLFGVEATSASADSGWITPRVLGMPVYNAFSDVAGLVDRPPVSDASFLYWSGAVWNTMVLVARAATLLDLCRRSLPFHTDVILAARQMDAASRELLLREWYPELPIADVSRDVLAPSKNLSLYTWPTEMGWSDLGTPDRMAAWRSLQRRPASLVTASFDEQVA